MAYCQIITTTKSDIIYNCSFLNNTYLLNSAVYKQFHFNNQTSIILTASYAFLPSVLTLSTFEFGLIYQFSISNYFVPFPIIFNCGSIVRSCQLKTITSTTMTSRNSESIRVPLTLFNYTTKKSSTQFKQMGLYLKQGRYQLSTCSLNNGQQMTDPQTIFHIQIQYEKSVGTSCNPIIDTCGSSSLTTCTSSICSCLSSSSSLVSYSDSYYCADMMNISNCQIFPSRCITWCNETTNYLCICPSDTIKIQRNNIFICELPMNSNNCSINDNNIRRCSIGQCCINKQCIDCSITGITTSKLSNTNDSIDEGLRIALGIIAGLLSTSVIILFSAFCWLHEKQKRHRISTKKSLSPSISSLYISPIQKQQEKFSSLITPIYQLSYKNENNNLTLYRTNSFRQAVFSGTKEKKQIIEHVSTKRDSFTYQKDGWSSPTFSTLEYILPSIDNNKNKFNDLNQQNNNIYQIILPSTPTLTHTV